MNANETLLHLSDLNLAESNREHARFLPPLVITERDGVLFTASGTRSPAAPFNVAMRVGVERHDPQQLLDSARAFFAEIKRGFSIQVRSHLDRDLIEVCEKASLVCMSGRAPGMVLNQRLASKHLAAGVECRVVNAANALDFVAVAAASYEPIGLAPAVTQKIFSNPSRWLAPQWHVRVIYERGQPVAGAMLLFSHGIAGVYWVGTIPSARGNGYADAIMRAVSNHAFDQGARAVVLQASKMGEPIYARMGYREITTYPWFLVMPQAS